MAVETLEMCTFNLVKRIYKLESIWKFPGIEASTLRTANKFILLKKKRRKHFDANKQADTNKQTINKQSLRVCAPGGGGGGASVCV